MDLFNYFSNSLFILLSLINHNINKLSDMSLTNFYEAAHHFIQRLKGSLDLEQDPSDLIYHRRNVIMWIQDQTFRIKQEKQKEKKNQHLFTNILNFAGMSQSNKKLANSELALERVKTIVKKHPISFDHHQIEDIELPGQIVESLNKLNKIIVPQYYGVVSAPLLKSLFLRSREDFDNCLRKGSMNNLKFVNLGSDTSNVIKYQRILVEQLFSCLFNRDNGLAMIFKVEVEKENFQRNIQIFCYVEDSLYKNQRILKGVQSVYYGQKKHNLLINNGKQEIQIQELSILNSFLTQILVLPLQTIVSDYMIEIDGKIGKLIKMHSGRDLTLYVKEHPSLRNPIFYFNNFIKNYQYSTVDLKKSLIVRELYSNFYEILNLLIEFIEKDFSFRMGNGKMNSLAFNQNIFKIIWHIFHDLIILPSWIEEVISPSKQTITLYEINNKIYPIFNEILKIQKEGYKQYQQAMLLLPIENYLNLNVSKINIERYKDIYVNLSSIDYVNYQKVSIFENIFAKTIKNYNLLNASIYESIYFLNFLAKNNLTSNGLTYYHPSWKNKKIWKQIVQLRNRQPFSIPYLSISLDILGFYFDFDTIEHCNVPFDSICNQIQNQKLFQKINLLINILRGKFEKKVDNYLSYLIQKAFKYKKYRVVEFLICKGVHINNYDDIFTQSYTFTRQSTLNRSQQRNKIKKYMKSKQPEMFRRYQWEELIHTKLREKTDYEHLEVIKSIGRGDFYVNRDIYSHLTSSTNMNNTLSRKDYMFSANRLIAKINILDADAYIEITEYPLLRYFYTLFLSKIGKNALSLNYCGFFTDTGKLGHLIECIPHCFNFQKGLSTYNQTQLKNFTNQDDISEAIIISMILMPTNVFLKNIIISSMIHEGRTKSDRKSLFIVDFYDFYQKNGFQSSGGTTELKVRNSLFVFDEMTNAISQKLMKKYSSLDIIQVIDEVFKNCSNFISEVNAEKPKSCKIPADEEQLFTLIFQNGYCQALAERMFKIKVAFEKALRNKNSIDHLRLLQILNPPLSYYYRELILSSNKLAERQKFLLDESFKKSLIVNQRLINFLPNSYYMQEVRDIFPNHYRRFGFQGPTENLQNLYRNILKYNIYIQKITDVKDFSHDVIQYYIRNVDLSTYTKEQRESLILKMQDYSKQYLIQSKNCLPLSVIRINNIDSIREKTLKFSDQRLKQLILDDAKCENNQFNTLIKKYHNINNLIIKNVSAIERIGQSFISISDTLYLKNLKYLSIIECSDVTIIDLKCDQLEHVTLRKNKSLSEIYIYSRKLKNMDCSECSKLRLENIGIYILKKINVLLCQNSCDGDVRKLQDKNYSVFLTRILRYLFNRFEQSNSYKLELIMTLIKLDLIDQKLFGFRSSQSYGKNLVHMFPKIGKEILVLVQSQIFDLFVRNSLVQEIQVDQLLKIEANSLKSIQGHMEKVQKLNSQHKLYKKEFSSFIFKQFIKKPLLYSQHLQFIKSLANFIETDKTFTFRLSLSYEIAKSDYVQIINTFNCKENLQKLDLIFENSSISDDFLLAIFTLDSQKNKICRLQFINCTFQINQQILIPPQLLVKTLKVTHCSFNNSTILAYFPTLNTLQITDTSFTLPLDLLYKELQKLKNLSCLKLVGLRTIINDVDLCLETLFEILKTLPKLQQLDFSKNCLNQSELQYFSSQIHKIKILQLKLFDFFGEKDSSFIQSFLYHQHLRVISIQFRARNLSLVESFIYSLSYNKSVLRVNIKTDLEIESKLFQKLNQNKVIQNFNSNQPIPNWLKNHIYNNSKGKSAIYAEDSLDHSNDTVRQNQDFYRIGLSLDGGGVRGLLLATELDYLSRKVGKPLHKIFDCIGGTSIGGILALASTGSHDGRHPVCSTSDLIDIFQLYGNRIFKKSAYGNIANLFENKYDVKSFQTLLNGYFRDSKLSDVLSETNVVVTAVNRLTNQDVIFRSLNAIFDRNQDFYMRDIARGTSAAPTYFPSAEIKNINANQRYSLIDGGVGLNNPSKLVIDDIIKITQNEVQKKNYFLLSLGTGRLINQAIPSNAGIKDLAPIIDSFTESANFFIQKDLSQNYKGHYLRVSPLINMLRKDGELDNTSPQILKVYKNAGLQAAEESFTNNIAFGKYKNQNLIEWLQQNTDRKNEV